MKLFKDKNKQKNTFPQQQPVAGNQFPNQQIPMKTNVFPGQQSPAVNNVVPGQPMPMGNNIYSGNQQAPMGNNIYPGGQQVPAQVNQIPNQQAPLYGGTMPSQQYAAPNPQVNMQGQNQNAANVNSHKSKAFQYLLLIIVCLATVIFAVSYIYRVFVPDKAAYATVEAATIGQTYSGNALVVRDETVYDDENVTSVEYEATEKSTVARTQVICYVYTSGYSTSERNTLLEYRNDIKDYQLSLLNSESTFDQKMDRLRADVETYALEVRDVVQGGSGDLTNMEETLSTAIDARQKYFSEKYTDDQRLSRLYDDEETQLKKIESWKKQNHASYDAIVSFYTDGYEYGLTVANYDEFNPSQVASMINGNPPETDIVRRGRTDIYRLIRQSNWYVLMLIENSTWNPIEGTTMRLTLEQYKNTTVDATITSFERSGNDLLVRLRISNDVTPALYIRTCSAQLGKYSDAFSVPESAVIKQNNESGVVVLQDSKKLFVPIKVVSKTDGLLYISPVYANTLHTGDTVVLF